MTKIALVGTAPSSNLLAPYDDPLWEIWACGPANAGVLPRCDEWFELHDLKPLERDATWTSYLSWLTLQRSVYTINLDPRFAGFKTFPKDDMLREFGPYFFTSSIAWMMALAISRKPAAIGLWGIDMTSSSEYGDQRAGCHHFLQVARDRGIDVIVPDESDLAKPLPMYGYREMNPMWRKLSLRRQEFEGRQAMLRGQKAEIEREEIALSGALENLDYVMKTWIS